MSTVITLATARRILTQLRHDRRTVAMMVLVPTLVMVLLYYVIGDQRSFDAWTPVLLCVFPFLVMFPGHLDRHPPQADAVAVRESGCRVAGPRS
ncbi:hypothetical protein [Planomonospora venezuelensis]|uniref:Uncharacterized protein n=1 Tax=Planomonospora venezuelensis TaxID=1999 RepID=A0A841CYU5_PLAVE|nr:hypothetical protein [Planomonospora venezuelensis]MBB5961167.1 hypothetical protein [Planomonospora venezuelensis]GIM99838.1 hypothetical protein Pve01_14970 [Planomonospora venezuelensis]